MSEKRIISALLCAVLAMCAETASRADQYIIPTPQRAVYHDAFLPLDCARIVVSDKPPKEVIFGVKQLNSRVTELGGKPMPVIGSSEYARDSVKAGVAIMIGATSDAFGKWQTAEGYAISTTPNNVVICRGYDNRGAYYATQSLIQLLSARKSADGKVSVWLREADIEDWPAFKLRILPYVAWAGPEYMEWVAQYKLNVAGIHYPVGKQWRNLPKDYLDKTDAACRFARETGAIEAIQYLNPYVTYPESSPILSLLNRSDIEDLVASFDRFLSNGGTMISLCVDDFFRMTPEERARFESHSEAQAFLVNSVYEPLKKRHPNMTMIFCPQWYAGVLRDREKHVELAQQDGRFSKDLGLHYYYLCSHIPKDVLVFWTGSRVRSHEVTIEQLTGFEKVAGRKPFYWDNTFYDFHGASFIENLFDPYPWTNKYPKDFYKYLDGAGMHLNSGHNEISKVGFLTAADYLWNPDAFDAEKSLRNALARVAGTKAAPFLIRFRDTAVELYKPLRAKQLSNTPADESAVRTKLDELKALFAKIRRVCPNKPLVDELEAHWIGDTERTIQKLFAPAKG